MWKDIENGKVFEHSGARIWYLLSGLPTGRIVDRWVEGNFTVYVTVSD